MIQNKINTEVMFGCDNCGKQTEFILEKIKLNPFPYSKGWIYVYDLKIKVLGTEIKIINNHFCCKKCFDKFIDREIKLIKRNK